MQGRDREAERALGHRGCRGWGERGLPAWSLQGERKGSEPTLKRPIPGCILGGRWSRKHGPRWSHMICR